jgi:hypothetical protein
MTADELSDAILQYQSGDHPADENEPVTAGWMKAVGFTECHDSPDWLVITSPDRGLTATTGERGWLLNDTDSAEDVVYVPAPKTRGAVRRLCAALSIPLKETT